MSKNKNSVDVVNHPPHYADNAVGGLECIEVTRHFMFSAGNAIKYVWRAGFKDEALTDLDKALFYVRDCVETRPLVGTSAREIAGSLGAVRGLRVGSREALVVEFVQAMADKKYGVAEQIINDMREEHVVTEGS